MESGNKTLYTEDEVLGYMILAARACGLSSTSAKILEIHMKNLFDTKSREEALVAYGNF